MHHRLILIFFMIGLGVSLFAQEKKTIEKNGMTVSYQLDGEWLKIKMSAPTDGWVAIGVNERNALAGSSFLIGRVVAGKAEVVDFYTVKPGEVPKVKELGGQSAVYRVEGMEKGKFTEISFDLKRFPNSKYHHDLAVGKTYYLHIAYSQDDDFAHHSMMRDLVEINL